MLSIKQQRIIRIKISTSEIGIDIDDFCKSLIKDIVIVCEQRDKKDNKIELTIDKIWI